jgi:hypothetical protein
VGKLAGDESSLEFRKSITVGLASTQSLGFGDGADVQILQWVKHAEISSSILIIDLNSDE